jgi:magnesium-transporting ATPase (P-type)
MEDDIKRISTFDGIFTLSWLCKFLGEIDCEAPNNRLHKFQGNLKYKGQTYPLDNDNILLRGCKLKNTKWCYGAVIYAGKETKLMMNSGKTKFKRTSIDRFLNLLILGVENLDYNFRHVSCSPQQLSPRNFRHFRVNKHI